MHAARMDIVLRCFRDVLKKNKTFYGNMQETNMMFGGAL